VILYLDTSSLLKLYVREQGSEGLRELAARAELIATSWATYPEARSAFACKRREGLLDGAEYRAKLMEFESQWAGYFALELYPETMLHAGDLTEKNGLRALDAIQLASALGVRDHPGFSGRSMTFCSADRRLVAAAQAEGLDCTFG